MRKAIAILAMVLAPAFAWGAGGNGVHFDEANVDLSDNASLQRGARLFVNYCLSCHSASYMRYNRMGEDLGISEEIVERDMMFAGDKIGDLMITTMPREDAKEWFGVAPPDLSTMARARGPNYLYTYMRSFYLDESTPSGWNNVVFPNVAMPHATYELQGNQRAVFATDADGNEQFERFEQVKAGKMTPEEYDAAMRDLTNFMVYLAEPAKLVRYKIGFWVTMFLLIMIGLSYALKKEYWRDVH
ncbi:MAG: cytochrome c1 [Proteobacteria bacterium]|nr:MAG: cytochrome c1 [Pseudomonadota bacterium]